MRMQTAATCFAAVLALCLPACQTESPQDIVQIADETVNPEVVETATAAALGLEQQITAKYGEAIAAGFEHPGEMVYAERCAACHDAEQADASLRAPTHAALMNMSPAQIRFALTSGKMKTQSEGLDRLDLHFLVDYLAPGGSEGYSVPETAMCTSADISVANPVSVGFGGDRSNTRYFGPEKTSVTAQNVGSLERVWAFGLPAASDARSYPVVTQDTLFLGVSSGHVFALDRVSGCVKWHVDGAIALRSALSLATVRGKPAIVYMDAGTGVHALDAKTGDRIWSKHAGVMSEQMGTGGITQSGNRLFVPLSATDVGAAMDPAYECCKGHGAVTALDADTGERLWVSHMTEDAQPTTISSVGTQLYGPSGAPVWTTPAVDPENGRVYIGTGENTSAPSTDTSDALMALDMKTGEKIWVYQALEQDNFNMACSSMRGDGPNCPDPKGPDFDFGGAVTFTTLPDGREVVVAGQKSGVVHVVDAATGALIWKRKVATGTALGGIHWGVGVSPDTVYAPSNDPAFPIPGYVPKPGLFALDLATGEPKWSFDAKRGCAFDFMTAGQNPEPWPECSMFFGLSAPPAIGESVVLAGSTDGKLRAFDTVSGEMLWSDDTVEPHDTINGVPAHGGAIDAAGPMLAGDMVFVQSGYAAFNQMPGNVLIAYRLAGE